MFKFIFRCLRKSLIILSSIFICISTCCGQAPVKKRGGRIQLELRRNVFTASYDLILKTHGADAVTDADALFLGGGHVAIAGLSEEGSLLAIDERPADSVTRRIRLHIHGWSAGAYTLRFRAEEWLFANYHIKLRDAYTQVIKDITPLDTVYAFSMDIHTLAMPADSRFNLVLQPKKPSVYKLPDSGSVAIYPNPFQGSLYIDTGQSGEGQAYTIQARDIGGRLMLSTSVAAGCKRCEIGTGHFPAGSYLLEVKDQHSGRRLHSLKMIKQ